jgi:chaperone modulatory protein CbpM
MLIITYQECNTRYGLSAAELQEFIEVGLLRPAPAEATLELDEEDYELLPRLARLYHELGINKEGIDIILAMRQRLVQLQAEVHYQSARARQLEQLLYGGSQLLDQ